MSKTAKAPWDVLEQQRMGMVEAVSARDNEILEL